MIGNSSNEADLRWAGPLDSFRMGAALKKDEGMIKELKLSALSPTSRERRRAREWKLH